MALKFRRGTTAQQSGSLAYGEPYVNTTLGTLLVGGASGDIQLTSTGPSSTFAGASVSASSFVSASSLKITGNAAIDGNLTLGGAITIGDASADTVNVIASLSSSLIPQTSNAFDLGSADKIWRDLYISTGSIKFVEGTTVVKTLSPSTLTALEAATGSANESISNLNTTTASLETKNSTLATYTASVDSKFTTLQSLTSSTSTQISRLQESTASLNSYTSSNDTTNTTQNSRLSRIEESTASLNSLTSSYARTNSTNIFNGNQTITGSLYVTQDLVVQGSSSIQNISSSTLNIGTNLITVATNNPSVRFGGIAVVDSGSAGGSGSFLYDSIQDEFVFVHRGNGVNTTSSVFLLGPETYDNLGNETYLTTNKILKSTGKEHIVDSNITDSGTLITLGSNTVVTGTLLATGTTLVSGSSQIVGSAITTNSITIAGTSTALGGAITAEQIRTAIGTVVTGSSQITGISNAQLTNSTISGISLGSNLATLTIGTGLSGTSYNGSGAVTIANTGVTSNVAGTGVTVSGATGAVTISIGQSVATNATPTFGNLTINGTITASGDITAFFTSDRRHKNNIQTIPNALDKISKLNGVTWEWNDDVSDVTKSTPKTGLIAQEVQEVLPQVVIEREDGFLALDYSKMVGLLVEAIKEQQTTISNLELQVTGLQNVITIFEDRMKEKGLL